MSPKETPDPNELLRRIEELQIALSHHQRLVEQLNEVVTSQAKILMKFEKQIPRLEAELQLLRNRQEQKTETQGLENERPPHY